MQCSSNSTSSSAIDSDAIGDTGGHATLSAEGPLAERETDTRAGALAACCECASEREDGQVVDSSAGAETTLYPL
jgi:hypothetical protein